MNLCKQAADSVTGLSDLRGKIVIEEGVKWFVYEDLMKGFDYDHDT